MTLLIIKKTKRPDGPTIGDVWSFFFNLIYQNLKVVAEKKSTAAFADDRDFNL